MPEPLCQRLRGALTNVFDAKGKEEALQHGVVTAVDGERIRSWEDFQSIVADHKPGDVITLQIERGSRDMQLKLKLEPQRVTGR